MLIIWIIIFIVSLGVLVKGADLLLNKAEKIGLAFGLSPFVIGIVIVGLGTSFPEIVSSLAATFKGVTEMVTANAVGSNIANILLVVGLSAVISGRLSVTKNLINIDLPLLAISTVLFLGVAWDREITFWEAIFLIVMFAIYLLYTVLFKDEEQKESVEILPSRVERRKRTAQKDKKQKITAKDLFFLALGIACLILGAKYLVESVIKLSEILAIGVGVISLAAVALGTSLPELIVSIKAAWKSKPELALGNIFGSNVFNILFVVGVSGLFKTLTIDEKTFMIGIPTMIAATLMFVISGISRKIHVYEGAMYLVIYAFFIGKLFGLL
jgi:cation:H+ antiporter